MSTKQEGNLDPYAEGKHIKNPEPNNGGGKAKRLAAEQSQPTAQSGLNVPHQTPNEPQQELVDAAKNRKGR